MNLKIKLLLTYLIPVPDVLMALKQGTIDGFGWSVFGVMELGWHEACNYR